MFIKNKKIDLVILAGGIGSRIKKHLDGKPKPMLKINNKYFLSYVINNLSKYNFNKIIILTRYKSNIIHKKFHRKNFNFINVECINEKKKMGTGGALHLIKKKVNDFVLVNGDSIFDINIVNFTKKIKKNCLGALALKKNLNQKSSKLNKLNLKNNYVYQSKKGKYMNGGVYFFKKKFLDYIPNKECSLESDILPELINKKKISGAVFNDFFIDIGSKTFLKKAPKMLLKKFSKKAVFLDRDGVINYDKGHVHKLKDFKFKKGVLKGLKFLIKKNYYIFIVTNQAGIAKGMYTENDFIKFHRQIKTKLQKLNIFFDDVQYSPFHPKATIKIYKRNSLMRKPGNKMIQNIKFNWDLNSKKSFMIGDKVTDMMAARSSRIKFFYPAPNFYEQIKSLINNC